MELATFSGKRSLKAQVFRVHAVCIQDVCKYVERVLHVDPAQVLHIYFPSLNILIQLQRNYTGASRTCDSNQWGIE